MSTITLEMRGDEKDLAAKLFRVEQMLNSVSKKMDETGGKSAGAAQAGQAAFDRFGSLLSGGILPKLTAVAGATAAVTAAFKLAMAEFNNMRQAQQEAAAATPAVAASRGDLLRNMVGFSSAQAQAAVGPGGRLSTMARSLGIPEAMLASAVAQGLTSSALTGPAAFEQALSAAAVTGQFFRDRPEEIARFAPALVNISKVIPGGGDALAQLGLIQRIGAATPIKSAAEQAANVPSAMIALRNQGLSLSEAYALYTATTQASGDTGGAQSGTGATRVVEQLRRDFPFLPNAVDFAGFSPFGGGGIAPAAARIPDVISFLQNNQGPGVAKYIAGLDADSKVKAVLQALLSDSGSDVARLFREGLATPMDIGGLRAEGQASLDRLAIDPLFGTTRLGGVIDTALEQMRTADPRIAQMGIVRDRLPEILRASGSSFTKQQLARFQRMQELDFGGGDPMQFLEEVIGGRISELQGPYRQQPRLRDGQLFTRQVGSFLGFPINRTEVFQSDVHSQPVAPAMPQTTAAIIGALKAAMASLKETMQQVADAANRTADNTAPRGGPLADPNMLARESQMMPFPPRILPF